MRRGNQGRRIRRQGALLRREADARKYAAEAGAAIEGSDAQRDAEKRAARAWAEVATLRQRLGHQDLQSDAAAPQ